MTIHICIKSHNPIPLNKLRCDLSQTRRVQWNKTYNTIALVKSAIEPISFHFWGMEFSIPYHVTIKQPIKRSEFNKGLYNRKWWTIIPSLVTFEYKSSLECVEKSLCWLYCSIIASFKALVFCK